MREPKDLVCKGNHQILKMCIKPTCTALSLFCDKASCPYCPREEHKKCLKVDLEGVTESINHHLPTKKYILEQMGGIEGRFFQSLRQVSDRLGEEIRLAGLGEREQRIAQEIFDRKNPTCLKGKEASSFFKNIEECEACKQSMNQVNNIIKEYGQVL